MEIQNKCCQTLAKIPSNFIYMPGKEGSFDRQVCGNPSSTIFVDSRPNCVRLTREEGMYLMVPCCPTRRIEAGRAGKGSPIFHVRGSILLR
jgi:hypothetical protein